MAKTRSKRYKAATAMVDKEKVYTIEDAVALVKKLPAPKFDQTVTLTFRMGVDPRQSDQMVRGTCPLPHGSGKDVRVLVFEDPFTDVRTNPATGLPIPPDSFVDVRGNLFARRDR